jgi:hypothetical protein
MKHLFAFLHVAALFLFSCRLQAQASDSTFKGSIRISIAGGIAQPLYRRVPFILAPSGLKFLREPDATALLRCVLELRSTQVSLATSLTRLRVGAEYAPEAHHRSSTTQTFLHPSVQLGIGRDFLPNPQWQMVPRVGLEATFLMRGHPPQGDTLITTQPAVEFYEVEAKGPIQFRALLGLEFCRMGKRQILGWESGLQCNLGLHPAYVVTFRTSDGFDNDLVPLIHRNTSLSLWTGVTVRIPHRIHSSSFMRKP